MSPRAKLGQNPAEAITVKAYLLKVVQRVTVHYCTLLFAHLLLQFTLIERVETFINPA